MAARQAELLPVPYYHVVFTLPAALGAIAYQNKAKVYRLLFQAAAEALTTIAADPKRLGAEIGLTSVLPDRELVPAPERASGLYAPRKVLV